MENIKLVALDMDGTLLDNHLNIRPYTYDILMKMQNKGVGVVLASGRDIISLKEFGNLLNIDQFPMSGYICLNGLEIYDYQGELLFEENKLHKEEALKVFEVAKKYNLDMVFFFKDVLYIVENAHTNILTQHFVGMPKYMVESINDIPLHEFNDLRKIALMQSSSIIEDMLSKIDEKDYDYCRVDNDWVEVNPLNIHKGSALKQYTLLKKIDIEDTIAFGNGENDIEMIETAGLGIAMANSFDSVKAIADDVCLDNESDGIAVYLEKYL
ncbi:MAG: Cof-type HAD-IIB family hydrolase [Erysipelotrichaceae bacterium]|nr:Cof-type HAD-IIB family hydrolase [Erysipelotrichaceae bacterium]